ncbi:oxidoreductase [Streptomyces daqingensis]|uniref:Oxidoreductase n=1 Tax=Streptomyces daqingensis TaxID=1472640 RepID=A0ABQ2MBB6_9ACTN|nr:FAD-binding oxidoreductase [Streptomyces daqingensis]GGO49318.1 oxidoreductase [Streptomyces daqingensis]
MADRAAARRVPFPADEVRGRVLLPDDGAWSGECSGFQAGYRHRPDVVVTAADADDVRTAVRHAAAHELPFAVQATGHGLGRALDGGVLVSTRRMAHVQVDAAARTARVGAGARWGDVVEEAARSGLAPLSGSGPGVGAVSYTLNGGVGLLAREFGYAADHVRSLDVVTSDGRLRHVAPDSEPDLFWALRGGGGRGGFGVVTELEIGLVPVERFYGGQLIFDGALAGDVVEAWRAWTATVPEELTSSVTMLDYPDVPALPEGLRGRYAAQVQIAYNGGRAEGERLVEPLRAVGPRLGETLRTMPYTESAGVYNEPDMPHGYQGANVLLGGELPDQGVLGSVLELTGPRAPAMTVLSLRHMGGALGREPEVPGAVGHREAGYLMVLLSVTEDAASPEADAMHERVFELVEPWTVGASSNFLYGRASRAVAGGGPDAHGSEQRRRLRGLKALVDPVNLFGSV